MRLINFPFDPKFKNLIKSLIFRILSDLRHGKAQEIENYISSLIESQIAEGAMDDRIKEVILTQYLTFGDRERLHLSPSCVVNNALFNLSSGNIVIGENAFFGHNVSLITGAHNIHSTDVQRMIDIPQSGNDIVVGNGVWICSNALILGPCEIGCNAVVAAGAVVKSNVEKNTVVAGVPARVVKQI